MKQIGYSLAWFFFRALGILALAVPPIILAYHAITLGTEWLKTGATTIPTLASFWVEPSARGWEGVQSIYHWAWNLPIFFPLGALMIVGWFVAGGAFSATNEIDDELRKIDRDLAKK